MNETKSEAACTPSFSSAELERFESWFKEHGMPLAARTGYRFEDVSRRAFEAGVRAEREACAKVCRDRARYMSETIRTASPKTSEHIQIRREAKEDEADFLAEKIMERSNVQSKWRAACGTSKRLQGAV